MIIAGGLLLLIIVFLVFAVYYASYRQTINSNPAVSRVEESQQKTIRNLVISIFAFMTFLVITMLSTFLMILGLRKVEQKNLFQPTKLDRYRRVSGMIYSLPSGGLVLNVTPNASPDARRVLFLHGNSHSLDVYADALTKIAEFGYNLFALEYRGYGPTVVEEGFEPNAETVLQDALQAWSLMGTSDSIVAGFSLGGAILSQIYEKFVPQPAQIVFLNSFGDIKQLMEDKLGNELGGTCAPLMRTRWAIRAPTVYRGKVVVVFTADDLTVPAKHGERLCQVFSKADLACQELPRGGHKYSVFSYIKHWISQLLPPTIESAS
jgi:hypothetical protein